MEKERIKQGAKVRFGIILLFIFCIITSMVSAQVTLNGPTTVTRGGVSLGEPAVDGRFNLSIISNNLTYAPMHLGLIVNPQTMTGDICDRPPYLNNASDPKNITLGHNAVYWPTNPSNPFTLRQVVPTGDTIPSIGCWQVPWNGYRYYGLVNTNNTTVYVGTLYPDDGFSNEFLATSVKPGTYRYHLQTDNGVRSIPGVDSFDYNVTVRYGDITGGSFDFDQWVQGRLVPASTVLTGHTIRLQGTNTDSQTTYIWVTGTNLPECGILLPNMPLRVPPAPQPANAGVDANGTWFYNWEAPCETGEYTFYVSSVDPTDVISRLCNNNGGPCYSSACGQGGICGLLNCPICGPDPAIITVTVKDPEMSFNISSIIERCCCPVFPCGSQDDSSTDITLSGQTGTPNQQLRIWMFGTNWIKDQKFLFGDYISSTDSRGSFSLDLRELMKEYYIYLCELDAGDYYVVIQVPGCDQSGYDVNPIDIPTNFIGYKAYKSLLSTLDRTQPLPCCPAVRDRYITVKFTIRDVCGEGSVDFTGTPVTGEAPLKVFFTDTSTFKGTEYLWTFGDGANSNLQNTEHVFQRAGQYDVVLTVKNGTDYQTRDKYEYINVTSPDTSVLKAEFSADKTVGASPLTIQFIDQSTGNPVAWSWIFGDTGTSSLRSPLHTYRAPGMYTVYLEIYDKIGNSANITKSGYIKADSTALRAAFRYSFPNSGDTTNVQFTDISEGSGIISWEWNFGDGTSSKDRNPLHQYSVKGCYTISLKVSNNVTSTIRSYQICI